MAIPLLIDENLSRKLVNYFLKYFPGSNHIAEFGLLNTSDIEIWQFAKNKEFCILTKDWDFQVLSVLQGCPPKVIRMNCGNKSTGQIVKILKSKIDTIITFQNNPNDCYLEIE